MKIFERCGIAASAACMLLLLPVKVSAAGGYLAGYENADPKPATVSWWSTIAYLVSLFAVFAFVVAMAYLASRYLGGHFARAAAAVDHTEPPFSALTFIFSVFFSSFLTTVISTSSRELCTRE